MISVPLSQKMAFHAAELLVKSGISWEKIGNEEAGKFRSPLCLTLTDDWDVVITLRQQHPNQSLELSQAQRSVGAASHAGYAAGTGCPSKRGQAP